MRTMEGKMCLLTLTKQFQKYWGRMFNFDSWKMKVLFPIQAWFLDNQGATSTAECSCLTGFHTNKNNTFLREVSIETSSALLQLIKCGFLFLYVCFSFLCFYSGFLSMLSKLKSWSFWLFILKLWPKCEASFETLLRFHEASHTMVREKYTFCWCMLWIFS